MNVHALQYDIVWEDPQRNFELIGKMVADAHLSPGDLVILPEMFSTGFSMDSQRVSQPSKGESFQFVSSLAKEYGVYAIAGWPVKTSDGCYNQAGVFDPQGSEIGRYSKIHSFSLAGESENYRAGNSLCIVQTGEIKVGVAICYDLRFPELFRQYVKQGVTMFVVIANWPASRGEHWRTLLCARAIENQAYVVGVNRIGTDPNVIDGYSGGSMIIDPRGRILAEGGNEAAVVTSKVSAGAVEAWRRKFPALVDMKGCFEK